MTLFDSLLASLRHAADYNRDDVVAPVCVLWPDEKREWERLAPALRAILPHFFTLGDYNPVARVGPAIWLRCVLAGTIPTVTWDADAVPILYLPGVARSTVRGTDDCDRLFQPLVELQYRGVWWSQVNAKDWTVAAYLQTDKGGLDLSVGKDQATGNSIRRAIEELAKVPVADLRAKSKAGELNSVYFDSLVSNDPVDDLLSWLADPSGVTKRWEAARWETLCSRCVADYGFDPARDGELVGAEKLGKQPRQSWKGAWDRFAKAPASYAGLVELLRKAKPTVKGVLPIAEEFWPQDNEAEEEVLRKELLQLPGEPVASARKTVLALDGKHGPRRDWVWAKLHRSPLAEALRHLATLAEVTKSALTGATTADMVKVYTEGGWKADAAVLDALAAVNKPADLEAVKAAVNHLYAPWLRDSAELFQQRVKEQPIRGKAVPRLAPVMAGTCVLFADGLRYDVGQKLLAALAGRVKSVQVSQQLVALPSVTPTSKPAVSPVSAKISGTVAGEEFRPCVAESGKDLTPDRFRKLLADDGVQFLVANETGDPTGRAWTEYGNLDSTGHNEGSGMARRIPELVATLVQRIESLLLAGWAEVRVVTDHGWLLLPNGLPKCELPKYLTATRWRRCAVVKPSASVEQMPVYGWHWADEVMIASPLGIDCFMAGEEYNHGGLSLQECVVPQFVIQAGTVHAATARIESVKWAGLRCRVRVGGEYGGCTVDLRDLVADATSTLTGAKAVGLDGMASLPVSDDGREGTDAVLVLLDATGNVLAKSEVTVGG